MRHTLGCYFRLLQVQLRSQLQYRTAFILDLVSTAMFSVTEFGALALVLNRFGQIDGWTLGEVAFLYAMVELAFSLMDMLFAGFDPPFFAQSIRQGTFDRLLLRPVPLIWQVFGSDLTLRRLGRVAFGIAIFILALNLNPISWTTGKLLYLPLVILGMVCFFGGLFIIGATLTFWTVESSEVMNILTYGGAQLMVYPMSIYPDWFRRIFTFVIPAIFLNYYPALYFLDKGDASSLQALVYFLSPVVGTTALVMALLFWQYGLRHYQSTGS